MRRRPSLVLIGIGPAPTASGALWSSTVGKPRSENAWTAASWIAERLPRAIAVDRHRPSVAVPRLDRRSRRRPRVAGRSGGPPRNSSPDCRGQPTHRSPPDDRARRTESARTFLRGPFPVGASPCCRPGRARIRSPSRSSSRVPVDSASRRGVPGRRGRPGPARLRGAGRTAIIGQPARQDATGGAATHDHDVDKVTGHGSSGRLSRDVPRPPVRAPWLPAPPRPPDGRCRGSGLARSGR